MNRTTLTFVAILALCASGFSQTTNFTFTGTFTETVALSNQYVGSPGEIAADINNIATFTINGTNSSFVGGDGVDTNFTADGVTGLKLDNDAFGTGNFTIMDATISGLSGVISNSSTSFTGGNGADLFDATVNKSAKGGDGLYAGITTTVRGFDSSISATGGDGGSIFSQTGGTLGDVSGGTGVRLESFEVLFGTVPILEISGGSYTGGNAGSVEGQEGVAANGGDGMYMNAQNALITGGTFTGGDGNTAKVTNGTEAQIAAARADGGDGLYVGGNAVSVLGGTPVNGGLTISNGVFNGGAAGSVNGVTGARGAGVHADGSEVIITGGEFDPDGLGFVLESSSDWLVNSTADITGGTFGDIELRASDASLENTITLGGTATFADLYLGGAGVNNVSVLSGAVSSGSVILTSGTANIDQWDSSGFDAVLLDGTMNFTDIFSLKNGWQLSAVSTTAMADFKNGLTVQSGGVLDAGLGTITGTDMEFKNGSQIISGYEGTDLGIIDVIGSLAIESGVEWTIDVGTNALSSGSTFDIATAATLTSGMTSNEVTFVGADKIYNTWLDVIGLLNDGNVLTATYDQDAIDQGLGVAGDTSTEYGKAVADFSGLVNPGSDAYDLIAALPDAKAAGLVISNSYIRTAEIASTLIGLQSVYADQVKHRIRSHMQYEGVGYPATYSPDGAFGWEAMRNFSDRLESGIDTDGMRNLSDRMESGISTDGLRTFSDSVEGDFGYDEVKGAMDSVAGAVVPDVDAVGLPTEWQSWGSGYGTYIDQDTTSEFVGYKASLAGGIIGIDKRINNVLLGVGGGYAHTVLQGYESKDARADTVHGVAYFSAQSDHAYLDASASYAFNAVDTEYDVLGYTGDFEAHTIGLSVGGGFAFTLRDAVVLTPEASILNTLYMRDTYTERSSIGGMPDLEWDDYDQWSHLAKVGATLSTVQKIDLAELEVNCRPEIRAHWLHEFNAEMDNETYMMAGGNNTIATSIMAREEDLIKVGTGVRLSKWSSDTTEFGLDVDGTFGEDYTAYIVSGKIIHRF